MQLLLVWTLQPPTDCHIEKKKTASATLKLKRSRGMRAGMPERQSSFVACPTIDWYVVFSKATKEQ